MHLHRASAYPNGRRKSYLYDFCLNHDDFRCTPDEFSQELADIFLEERLGVPNCEWCRDKDGHLVVAGLELADGAARLVITHDGFVFLPTCDARPNIFISYAREDVEAAQRLAGDLIRAGFRPWIDRRHLLGGHRWKSTIEETIQKSDFFVALLSSRSVDKRGFVQREIRRALDVAEEMPERRIFIIPVRLDESEPGHSDLREFCWVDLFPVWDIGVKLLVRSLYAGRLTQGKTSAPHD